MRNKNTQAQRRDGLEAFAFNYGVRSPNYRKDGKHTRKRLFPPYNQKYLVKPKISYRQKTFLTSDKSTQHSDILAEIFVSSIMENYNEIENDFIQFEKEFSKPN